MKKFAALLILLFVFAGCGSTGDTGQPGPKGDAGDNVILIPPPIWDNDLPCRYSDYRTNHCADCHEIKDRDHDHEHEHEHDIMAK